MEITVDQQHASDQLNRFNQTMQWYAGTLNLAYSDVLRRQSGLLARDLVKISPPLRKEQTKAKIEKRIGKFTTSTEAEVPEGKEGNGSVDWFSFTSNTVYGVSKDMDYRHRSESDLLAMYKFLSKKAGGRTSLDLGKRGKQTFRLFQKILARRGAITRLLNRLANRIGRLKAAWASAWQDLGAPGERPPEWVMKHVAGSKAMGMGWSIDASKVPGTPSVTIGNRAAGVGNLMKLNNALIRNAIRIRTQAMMNDVKFAIEHPKEWQQREAQAKLNATINDLKPV